MKLQDFLTDKPLFYKKFDPLRMQKAYDSIRCHLTPSRIVHLIGTNGKGSTGRYLADMLRQAGINVGHYTSPHIKIFNERIWMNGSVVDDMTLDKAYDTLIKILPKEYVESLSYFEFTTFIAMIVFKDCDVIVLEAGLGGEFDATSVFENELTLLTPIGLDHADFLGTSLTEVCSTKIRGIQKAVISAKQVSIVEDTLQDLSRKRDFRVLKPTLGEKDLLLLKKFSLKNQADYLVRNFKQALLACRQLGFSHEIQVDKIVTLFGRLTKVSENIHLDVGHNLLAAEEILTFYGDSKVNLVYNTLEDKAYKEILTVLKPIIKKVFIIEINDERALDINLLEEALKDIGIAYELFSAINPKDDYLVFGSFVVVEAFIKSQNIKMK